MSGWKLKLRMLQLYWPALGDWWREVWLRDAGQRMCCDGRMCGCYGSDYASMWEALLKEAQS